MLAVPLGIEVTVVLAVHQGSSHSRQSFLHVYHVPCPILSCYVSQRFVGPKGHLTMCGNMDFTATGKGASILICQ